MSGTIQVFLIMIQEYKDFIFCSFKFYFPGSFFCSPGYLENRCCSFLWDEDLAISLFVSVLAQFHSCNFPPLGPLFLRSLISSHCIFTFMSDYKSPDCSTLNFEGCVDASVCMHVCLLYVIFLLICSTIDGSTV